MQQIYLKKAQGTNKLAYHAYSHYFQKKKKKKKTFLRSQISAAITPDYCLTKRQKRWGSKQTRRANEDMAAS